MLRGYMFKNVNVITGGFPCQDISVAGKQAGIKAKRSGLWTDLCRLIGEIRPRYAIVENVPNLLSGPTEQRGGWFGQVLGDLAQIGYDSEWHSIQAANFGAPHIRDRVWIIATPMAHAKELQNHVSKQHTQKSKRQKPKFRDSSSKGFVANTKHSGIPQRWRTTDVGKECDGQSGVPGNVVQGIGVKEEKALYFGYSSANVANSSGERLQGCSQTRNNEKDLQERRNKFIARCSAVQGNIWESEPNVGRVAHGIPKRVDRLRGLGNAVVPQILEFIGYNILEEHNNAET